MTEADFNQIATNLNQIHQLGAGQVAVYKDSPQSKTVRVGRSFIQLDGMLLPRRVAVGKIISDPKIFLFSNIEAYWTLYKSALDIFGYSGVQFLMRPIMETAYSRIVLYAQKSSEEQTAIAAKFWICMNGLLRNRKDYAVLVAALSNEEERKDFLNLQDQGYPSFIFHKKLHELLPHLFNKESEKELKEALAGLWDEKSLKIWPIGEQIRGISMLLHGNPVTVSHLQTEQRTLGYILRCAKVLQFTGITTLKVTEKKFGVPVSDKLALKKLEHDFGIYLTDLWQVEKSLGKRSSTSRTFIPSIHFEK